MIKQLGKHDRLLSPFVAARGWRLSNVDPQELVLTELTGSEEPVALEFIDYSSGEPLINRECNIALEQQASDLAIPEAGEVGTGTFFPDREETNQKTNTFKRLVYDQMRLAFYNDYKNPLQIFGIDNIDFPLSKTNRFLANEFVMFTIPRNVFGDRLSENTIQMFDRTFDDNLIITDDGEGNLIGGVNLFSKVQEIRFFGNKIFDGDGICIQSPLWNEASQSWNVEESLWGGCSGDDPTSPCPVPAPPADPSDLVVTSGSAILTWVANGNTESGFVIEKSTDSGSSWASLVTASAGATTYTDTDVTNGYYSYRMFAFNGLGTSGYSNTASINFFEVLPSTNNMILWYAADRESAYSSSQTVTIITDHSGHLNTASLSDITVPVKYATNVLHGKPAFFFTASGGAAPGFFNIKDFGHVTSSLTQSAEYITVIRSTFDPLNSLTRLGPIYFASGSNLGTPSLPYVDGKLYELFATSTGNRSGAKPTNMSSSFRIINMISTTSSFEMIYDGRTIYYDSSSTANTFGLHAPYFLGRCLNNSDEPWEGMIAELILHSPALSVDDRDQTYDYLNAKYGLTASYTSSNVNPTSSFSDQLALWLTIDSLVGLTTGSNVSVWSSSYGNNHFSSSGTAPAIYKGGQINGRPAVCFSTSTFLTASQRITFEANAPMTAIAVVRASADSALTSDPTQNFQLRVRRGGVAANGLFFNAQPEIVLNTSKNVDAFQTAVWKRHTSGSTDTLLRSMPNDYAETTIAINESLFSKIGGGEGHGIPLTGSICEFMVWHRALGDWEIFELWKHYIYPKYNL
jgi:hypothetical protein